MCLNNHMKILMCVLIIIKLDGKRPLTEVKLILGKI